MPDCIASQATRPTDALFALIDQAHPGVRLSKRAGPTPIRMRMGFARSSVTAHSLKTLGPWRKPIRQAVRTCVNSAKARKGLQVARLASLANQTGKRPQLAAQPRDVRRRRRPAARNCAQAAAASGAPMWRIRRKQAHRLVRFIS